MLTEKKEICKLNLFIIAIMKTIFYFYALAVLAAVFALNSCGGIESKEQVEKRSVKAIQAYLDKHLEGYGCNVVELTVAKADTLSAEKLTEGLDVALRLYGVFKEKHCHEVLNDTKKKIKNLPMVIIYTWSIYVKSEEYPEIEDRVSMYGVYNADTKKIDVSTEPYKVWCPEVPRAYSEAVTLLKELL